MRDFGFRTLRRERSTCADKMSTGFFVFFLQFRYVTILFSVCLHTLKARNYYRVRAHVLLCVRLRCKC